MRAGFLDPSRGERGEYRFHFRDLVILRTAKGLLDKSVAPWRIRNALAELKRQIGEDRPITSVELDALGLEVVAKDGEISWLPTSGQAVFEFEPAKGSGGITRSIPRRSHGDPPRLSDREMTAEDWFELGSELEIGAPKQARDAYRRALELRPSFPEVRMNLGRLLHEAGELEAAEAHYRIAFEGDPEDPSAAFRLGVVLDELGRRDEAILAFEAAVRSEPLYRDAVFNLARVLEGAGRFQEALRVLGAYRNLTEG